MRKLQAAIFLGTLPLLLMARGHMEAQGSYPLSTRARQQVLSLDFADNGKRVSAWVGQQIELSLRTVGPRQYGVPEISSPAIRLVSTAQEWPSNPGGPGFVYIFQAVAAGQAQVKVPVIDAGQVPYSNDITFTARISVRRAGGSAPPLQSMLRPDQANTTPWRNAWTNLNNFARQTFVPSLPRLTGVEVELLVANPGAESADISMMVLNGKGDGLALVSKSVPVADCGHVLFILPRGGLPVSPGETYSIKLSGGDGLFGWKYVVGGYGQGAAWFNNKPLLKDARSTFLFRTFGGS